MKKLLLPAFALTMLFTACDSSDDDKVYTEEEKIEKDVNGEYLFAKANIGDMPVAEVNYNSDNLIESITSYDSDEYKSKVIAKVEKEYKGGKVSKVTTRSFEENYKGEKTENVGGVLLEYDSKGNLMKINEWEDEESDVFKYITNVYDSKNLLIESKQFCFSTEKYNEDTQQWEETEGEWVEDDAYVKYEYNSDQLLVKTILVSKEGKETTLTKLKYDDKKNPIEVYTYNSPEHEEKYDPATGEQRNVMLKEGKLESFVKIEYDYTMKNFLKHSIGLIFPELTNFNMYNAPKRITQTGTVVAGSITYHDFNDGGYPQLIKYIGNNNEGDAYKGEVNLEFVQKK
jgi:hypothetical protein